MATMSTARRILGELEQRLHRRRGPGDVVHVVREGDPPEPLERARAEAEARGARLIVIRVIRGETLITDTFTVSSDPGRHATVGAPGAPGRARGYPLQGKSSQGSSSGPAV